MPPIAVGRVETKTNTNGQHFVAVWVRFGFQLDLLRKTLDYSNGTYLYCKCQTNPYILHYSKIYAQKRRTGVELRAPGPLNKNSQKLT